MDLATKILVMGLPLLIAVVVHEVCHGLAALMLGDDTAKRMGRLTLNPIPHIDPFMTIILPGLLILSGSPVIFGGAKPVPVDTRRLRNPKRDMALVALAGPVSNMVLMGLSVVILFALDLFDAQWLANNSIGLIVLQILSYSVVVNLVLAVFNLFPIPPLDGGRIAVGLLPMPAARALMRLERWGLLIVFALLYLGVIDAVLRPILEFVLQSVLQLRG